MTTTADLLAEMDAEIAVQQQRYSEATIAATEVGRGLALLRAARAALSAKVAVETSRGGEVELNFE